MDDEKLERLRSALRDAQKGKSKQTYGFNRSLLMGPEPKMKLINDLLTSGAFCTSKNELPSPSRTRDTNSLITQASFEHDEA